MDDLARGWRARQGARWRPRSAVVLAVIIAGIWAAHVQSDADSGRARRATVLIAPIPGMISVQRRVLMGDEPAAVALVAARAEHPLGKMKPAELLALAAATGTLLGLPPDGEHRDPADLLAGQETLRLAMVASCADCAPAAANMVGAIDAFGARPTSAAVVAEAMARGSAPGVDASPPLGEVGVAIRRGGTPILDTWTTPGVAGFAALEAARAGRVDLAAAIRGVARGEGGVGPADRLAADAALSRMGAAR